MVPRPNPTPLTVSKEPPAEPVLGVIYTRAGVTLKDCMKGNSKPSGNPSGITTEMSFEVLLLMSLITTEALVVVTAVVVVVVVVVVVAAVIVALVKTNRSSGSGRVVDVVVVNC